MTDARATQVSLEQWLTTNPRAQLTQVALEMWASAAATIPEQAVVTQVALEQWASVAAGGNAYSLAAAEGTYILSGQTQPFISLNRTLAAAEGTYALSGKSAAIGKINSHGVYALSGQPIVFNRGYSLAAAPGAYALSGQAQHFGVGRLAAGGTYTLSGKAITNPVHLSLIANSGAYLRTSFGATLIKTPGGPDAGNIPQHSNMFRSDVGAMKTQ